MWCRTVRVRCFYIHYSGLAGGKQFWSSVGPSIRKLSIRATSRASNFDGKLCPKIFAVQSFARHARFLESLEVLDVERLAFGTAAALRLFFSALSKCTRLRHLTLPTYPGIIPVNEARLVPQLMECVPQLRTLRAGQQRRSFSLEMLPLKGVMAGLDHPLVGCATVTHFCDETDTWLYTDTDQERLDTVKRLDRKLPNLVDLTIQGLFLQNDHVGPATNEIFRNVRHLRVVPNWDPAPSFMSILAFLRCMPSLEHVSVHLRPIDYATAPKCVDLEAVLKLTARNLRSATFQDGGLWVGAEN